MVDTCPVHRFHQIKRGEDVFELSVIIYLEFAARTRLLQANPTKPIQIRRIRLWDKENRESLCDYPVRTKDSSISANDDNRALITYQCDLQFRHPARKCKSTNELVDNLSIEIYDSMSTTCSLQFEASQIIGKGARGAKVVPQQLVLSNQQRLERDDQAHQSKRRPSRCEPRKQARERNSHPFGTPPTTPTDFARKSGAQNSNQKPRIVDEAMQNNWNRRLGHGLE